MLRRGRGTRITMQNVAAMRERTLFPKSVVDRLPKPAADRPHA
jgi:hypothetical protein